MFGAFVQATIRHRIQDGKNTSWALVTMADTASVDKALVRSYLAISCRETCFSSLSCGGRSGQAAPAVMAGSSKLVLNRFSTKQAAASTGAMGKVQKEAEKKKVKVKAKRVKKKKRRPRSGSNVSTASTASGGGGGGDS